MLVLSPGSPYKIRLATKTGNKQMLAFGELKKLSATVTSHHLTCFVWSFDEIYNGGYTNTVLL